MCIRDRFDESEQAAAVAAHLGTEHVELTATTDALVRLVERMPHVYDEPFADVSQLPTLLLSELTRQHVTVALSGDGGDELFLGYPRYVAAKKRWEERRGLLACTIGRAGMLSTALPKALLNKVSLGKRPWRLVACEVPELSFNVFKGRSECRLFISGKLVPSIKVHEVTIYRPTYAEWEIMGRNFRPITCIAGCWRCDCAIRNTSLQSWVDLFERESYRRPANSLD